MKQHVKKTKHEVKITPVDIMECQITLYQIFNTIYCLAYNSGLNPWTQMTLPTAQLHRPYLVKRKYQEVYKINKQNITNIHKKILEGLFSDGDEING